MNMPEELKPCPFCLGTAEVVKGTGGNPDIYVRCKRCKKGDNYGYCREETAIESWNARATPAPAPVTVSDEMVKRAAFFMRHEKRCNAVFSIDYECSCGMAAARAALESARGAGDGWVACSERMPEANTGVMVCCMNTDDKEGPFVACGFFNRSSQDWQSQDSFQCDKPIPWPVTHWRPLPQPPTDKAREEMK